MGTWKSISEMMTDSWEKYPGKPPHGDWVCAVFVAAILLLVLLLGILGGM